MISQRIYWIHQNEKLLLRLKIKKKEKKTQESYNFEMF